MTQRNVRTQWLWGLGLGLGLLLAGSVTLSRSLWADMVITDTDAQYEGDVLSDDQNMIIIQTDRGLMYIRRDKVKALSYKQFPESSAKVEEVTGTVEYERKARPDDWREVVTGMKLRPGDRVRTGEGSKVIMTVAGQAVTALEANSNLTISEVRRNEEGDVRVRLAMETGQLWNDVGTLNSSKSRYTVETPQASCGVRGTVYAILTDEGSDETTVATVEGEVQVIQKREEGETLAVDAGQQATLGKTGGAATDSIDAGFLSQWEGYSGQFQRIRASMELDNLFARFGLTRQQGYMAIAGAGGFVIIVLGVVVIRRRR